MDVSGATCKLQGSGHSAVVGKEAMHVVRGVQAIFWQVKLLEGTNGWVMLGIIANATPTAMSYSDATVYAWAGSNQVYIAGNNTGSHGGWIGWKSGDVATFKLEETRVSMRVARLGDTTFEMGVVAGAAYRVHIDVHLHDTGTRVKF